MSGFNDLYPTLERPLVKVSRFTGWKGTFLQGAEMLSQCSLQWCGEPSDFFSFKPAVASAVGPSSPFPAMPERSPPVHLCTAGTASERQFCCVSRGSPTALSGQCSTAMDVLMSGWIAAQLCHKGATWHFAQGLPSVASVAFGLHGFLWRRRSVVKIVRRRAEASVRPVGLREQWFEVALSRTGWA